MDTTRSAQPINAKRISEWLIPEYNKILNDATVKNYPTSNPLGLSWSLTNNLSDLFTHSLTTYKNTQTTINACSSFWFMFTYKFKLPLFYPPTIQTADTNLQPFFFNNDNPNAGSYTSYVTIKPNTNPNAPYNYLYKDDLTIFYTNT